MDLYAVNLTVVGTKHSFVEFIMIVEANDPDEAVKIGKQKVEAVGLELSEVVESYQVKRP